mgnify:FL=1|jgi:hypothetical protein
MHLAPVAVITGDLVASTRRSAAQVDAAMQAIRDASRTIAGWHAPPADTRFTRHRGDGWQIVLAAPHHALRAAVVIQARLIALGMESRMFIGIGTADTLGTDTLADASGDVFTLSGQGLDDIGNRIRIGFDGSGVSVEDRLIAELLAERMQRWTAAQAEAAALQLASPTRIATLGEVGKTLNISPQAVNDRAHGAGSATIALVLSRWEALKASKGWGNTE